MSKYLQEKLYSQIKKNQENQKEYPYNKKLLELCYKKLFNYATVSL
jgi:hypothetical protein